MTEVIKKWITKSTGLVMNMDTTIFAVDVMDGTILARILHSYNVISQDQMMKILPTDSPNIAFRNLKKVRVWLTLLDINCDDDVLIDLSMQKETTAIKLFYQLYLALHDKDKLHFITKKRANERLHPTDTRFDVVPSTSKEKCEWFESPDHPLSGQLVERQGVIEWNQHRYEKLLEDYDIMREKYAKYIEDKFGITYHDKFRKTKKSEEPTPNVDELNVETESVDYTYEDLVQQEQNALGMERLEQDPKAAKKIVNKIKRKRRKDVQEKELKVYQQKLLLMELWNKLVAEQEKEFDETISKKMLKQSEYEKQMVTKMMEVRQQKHNILQNQRFMDEETLKKREEEFLENVFLRQKSVGDQKYSYYFEKNRTLELHRRLHAEKLRLKAERHYNMCKDVVKDMVNVAMRHSEYKEQFGEEVPRRVQNEWANLFIKQQSIFNIMNDIEDLIQCTDDLPKEVEEIFCLETARQNALDQRDFENYFCNEWPWQLSDLLTQYEDNLLPIELGMNVLGHDVHRVLLTKYPKPKPPPKPDIPKAKIAACINGLPDLTILPILQKLLKSKGVRIIEMQQVINFCLDVFKSEIATEYIDNALMEETDAAFEELEGKGKKGAVKAKKGAKTKADSKKGKTPPLADSLAAFSKMADKKCQTPRIYPCEEIVLSAKGELGKTAYDLLNIGEPLTDNLVIAMFIEYLNSNRDIGSWVLINFPTNFAQAVLLEEGLTGIQVPGASADLQLKLSTSIGDIADLEYRESQWEQEERNVMLRKSKLLPNPDPIEADPFYDTYLTAYIHVQSAVENTEVKQHLAPDEKTNTEDQKEEPDPLEQFYADQGCNYAFFFKTFDLATIKHLAKLVIGDYSVPPKASLELFGDTVLYIEANTGQGSPTPGKESKSKTEGGKKEKPSKSNPKQESGGKPEGKPGRKPEGKPGGKPEGKAGGKPGGKPPGKGGDKTAKAKKGGATVVIEAVACTDKETQMPEILEIEEVVVEAPPEPRAGEKLWRYFDLSFPDYFQVALATLWEKLEDVYICDFKELFFMKRIILNAVMPYLTYIKQHMDIFLARPDNKQNYMHDFQSTYNEIDEDMRDDEELKAEVHCRIAEFREKLWEICDRRMRESEDERQRIIRENWVAIQLCELTNNYIVAMQLEIDRCCDAMQFLTDYFSGLITKMPSQEPLLQKIMLRKIALEFDGSDGSIVSASGNLKEETIRILTEPNSDSSDTTFHQRLDKVEKTANSAVSKWMATCQDIVVIMDSMFKPGKKGKPDRGKKDKGAKGEKKLPKFVEPEEEVKEVGERLIEEWKCALQGEFLRVKLRLNMLTERGWQELNDVFNSSKKSFYRLYNDIRDRYNREIQSVDTACELLARAVEAETRLQPELILDGEKFYIQPNILLFPEPLPVPDPPIMEPKTEAMFTIAQLSEFATICMDLAPNASIPERALVYLLQDMIVQNAEDGKGPMVPLLWKRLEPNQVSLLSQKLFGDVEFVDWKDFIIYNMCIPFPTEDELLAVREQFRLNDPDSTETVKDYQFYSVIFWFERAFRIDSPQEMLRLKLIKELLYKLYRISEDTLSYTAFLLAFCKDVNPVLGFAKALTLAFGKHVCWDVILGEMYMGSIREQRYLDEQEELKRQKEHETAIKHVESVLDSLVDTTVHLCDSVVIEDYISETNFSSKGSGSTSNHSSTPHQPSPLGQGLISTRRVSEDRDSLVDIEFANLKGQSLEQIFSNNLVVTSVEERFSNVEIGFQPTYTEPKVYLLPFEAVLTVLTCSLPWHARARTVNDESLRERLEAIYKEARNLEFSNDVFTHELLNNRGFKDLLVKTFKFVERCPPKIVEAMVGTSSSN